MDKPPGVSAEPVAGLAASTGYLASEAVFVASILLFAAAVHFVKIDTLPPGLHQDEAVYLVDSESIRYGAPQIYYGEREPLYMYVVAGASLVFGASPLALRITSGLFSIFAVAAGGAFAGQLFGRSVALITAAGLASSLWLTALGRTGFRAITVPAVECLGLALFWRATRTGRVRDYALSGVALGLSLYTYLSARFLPIALLIFVALAAIFYRSWLTERLRGLIVTAACAFATCVPLGLYGLRHPEIFFGRPDQVALPGGPEFLPALVSSGERTLGMLWVLGDLTWRHNLSGAPVFDPLNAIFFVIGLVVALGGRGPASLLLLVVLAAMLVPGMLSIDSPHFLRTDGALGPIYVVWAIGVSYAARRLPNAAHSRRVRLLGGVLAIAIPVLVAGVRDTWGYFVTYASDRTMPAAYNVQLAAAGRALANSPIWRASRSNVYVSDLFEIDHASVAAFLYSLLTPSDRVRWLDADIVGTFIPQNELIPLPMGSSLYVADGDGRLTREALGSSVRNDTLVAVDGGTTIDIVEADSSTPANPANSLPGGPVAFGNVLMLEGAWVRPAASASVVSRTVALRWKIIGRPSYQPSLFVHVDDDNRRTLAQSDLDVRIPANAWRVGQEWVTYHQVQLPAGTLPGVYSATVGVYNKNSNVREEATKNGRPISSVSALNLIVDQPIEGVPTADRWMNQAVAPGLILIGTDSLPAHIEAGTPLPITLVWRAVKAKPIDYNLTAMIRTSDGQIAGQWRGPVGSSTYQTSHWARGAVIRQTIVVPITPAVSGGTVVTLIVRPTAATNATGPDLPGVDLGRLIVDAAQHSFTQPSPRFPLDVGYGDLGRLIGFDVLGQPVRAGNTVDLHLVWRATRASTTGYTVFVHVLDENNHIVAQRDEAPVHATRATTSWVEGEYLDDPHAIPISPTTPTGRYRIEIGLYDPATGARVSTDAGLDHVVIGELQIQGR